MTHWKKMVFAFLIFVAFLGGTMVQAGSLNEKTLLKKLKRVYKDLASSRIEAGMKRGIHVITTDPIINHIGPWIGNLSLVEVMDRKKAMVADPPGNDKWIATPKHNIFPAKEYNQALSEEKFEPQSEKEAIEAAEKILLVLHRYSSVVNPKFSCPEDIPKEVWSKIHPPKAEKKNEGYEVTFFATRHPGVIKGLGMVHGPIWTLDKHVFHIGKGFCKANPPENVWKNRK